MVVQSSETKKQTSLIELLGVSPKGKNEKANNTFAQLLSSLGESAKTGKSSAKQADFTALIDPKLPQTTTTEIAAHLNTKESVKISELQTLLSGKEEDNTLKILPNELLNVLSNDQVHSLIHRAKEFLKNEIMAKAPEQQLDPKSLPKTLMGLVRLADKMGLDPQAITLSHINEALDSPLPLPAAMQHQLLLNAKAMQESSKEPLTNEPSIEAIVQLINEAKSKETKTIKETIKETSKETAKEPIKEPGKESTKESVKEASKEAAKETKKEAASEHPLKVLLQAVNTGNENAAALEVPKPHKEAKAPSSNSDLLIGLLQGDIKPKGDESSDTESKKLENEPSKSASHLTAPKADALEVKTKEAAQSMRYFAADLKEAVENYKPPFTRLTMTLNPEKLGEVEVTLIQRGNNVHVNIQSNNANSVAFLAHNATELKAQLSHQGITNATMNFMSGGENQHQNPQQQQNRYRSYPSFEELEFSQEALSALELIIPHYA